jgi:hypothetical protein
MFAEKWVCLVEKAEKAGEKIEKSIDNRVKNGEIITEKQ